MNQLKGKCRSFGKLGHKEANCNSKQLKDDEHDIVYSYCKKHGHVKANCFKSTKKNLGE